MNVPNPQEAEYTRPIEFDADQPSNPTPPLEVEEHPEEVIAAGPAASRPEPAHARDESVLYVPLAVTVGDGFKFGCGFFMAFVLALLLGFVLVAVLFVLTSLLGVNLFVAR